MQTLRLISPSAKLRLIEGILYAPLGKVTVRATAKRLKINPGYVSVFLRKMAKQGLIRDGLLCNNDPRVMAMRLVFNIDRVRSAWPKLKKLGVTGFGIFGSWTKGANTSRSDLDIWVKINMEPNSEKLSQIRSIIRDESGVSEISLVVLTPGRANEIKTSDSLFYSTLINSFHVGGENID